ncbi:MAG: carbohydrate-binding protein [Saprospiraceae bacterium]
MLKRLFTFLTILLLATSVNGQGFLHTEGQNIVDENGNEILLRGMGLGGWMLQEGYMLQTAGFANAQYQIKEKIEELIGTEKTEEFYDAWLANHATKADIDALKEWGFNSVRLPMHYNLFTLPIQEEPVAGENTWLDKGFILTDSLISWCAQNEMYVILDLHAAPGGQGYDQAISDYNPDLPSIWESLENRNKAAALWKKIAERYVDETWVAGYDLLNEPNWDISGNTLRATYRQFTDSIRSVDTNHMLFIEGNWFANDFTNLTPPWDDNLVYSPHKYWSVNDQASIQWVLDMRNEHNVPLYLGESGENSNVWFRDAIRLFEDNNIGWAWWPMKKVESIAGPLSIVKSEEYESLLDYWSNGGTTPTAEFAELALMDLAEKTKIENCIFQKDVIDAMFRQVYSDETIPFNIQDIPGVVHPTDFSMGVAGEAYHEVTSLANYSVTTGNYTSWNDGWAYRNDAVDIEVSQDNSILTNGYNIGFLGTDEWMQYDIDVSTAAIYDVEVRVASGASGGKFHLSASGADLTAPIDVPGTGDWQNWQSITFSNVVLDPADTKLRFYVDEEGFNLGSMEFTEAGSSNTIPTIFVSGITIDESTIGLSINKPLDDGSTVSTNDFTITANGTSVPILSASIDEENNRLLNFTIDHEIVASESIRASYSGTTISATDGTDLETFTNRLIQNTIIQLIQIPGRMEAEDYFFQSGVQLENTTDAGGGQNIGFLDQGDYLDYQVNISQAGLYSVDYRNASQDGNGKVMLQIVNASGQGVGIHSIDFTPTGGWQTWTTTSKNAALLSPGIQTLRLLIQEGPVNINWLEFSFLTNTQELESDVKALLYPNPNNGLFQLEVTFAEAERAEVMVYNMLGQHILRKSFAESKDINESLDLRRYGAGNYIISIISQTGKTKTLKTTVH